MEMYSKGYFCRGCYHIFLWQVCVKDKIHIRNYLKAKVNVIFIPATKFNTAKSENCHQQSIF